MNNKTIKNPLTVIAIFAGVAEAGGTAILPLLEMQSQQVYLWFLIIFPFVLIVLFFLTLNFNHRVLYAPSDFNDEANFMNIAIRKLEPEEVLSEEAQIENSLGDENKIVARPESERIKDHELAKEIAIRRNRDAKMAEKLAVLKLEKLNEVSLDLDMELQFANSSKRFDALVKKQDLVKCFEIKYFRGFNTLSGSMWNNLINGYKFLLNSLSEDQKAKFEFNFVIVTDADINQMKRYLNEKFNQVDGLKIIVKVFKYDSLIREFGIKNTANV